MARLGESTGVVLSDGAGGVSSSVAFDVLVRDLCATD